MGMDWAHLIPLYPPETVRSVCWVAFLLDFTQACKSVNRSSLVHLMQPQSREQTEQTICLGIPGAGALLL